MQSSLDPNQPVRITLTAQKWNALLAVLQERVGPVNELIAEIARQGNAAVVAESSVEFQPAENGPRRSRAERISPNSG